jgi:hypothetical protein
LNIKKSGMHKKSKTENIERGKFVEEISIEKVEGYVN